MANSSQGTGTLFTEITLISALLWLRSEVINISRQCVGRFLLPLVQECYGWHQIVNGLILGGRLFAGPECLECKMQKSGARNENIVQNHLNIALLNVF